jgi:hypothetical protein
MTDREKIYVKAKLTLRTTADGGRQTGIKTGYRPNHVFEYNKNDQFLNTYIGQIDFDKDKIILPGETEIVTVCFLSHPDLDKYLHVGRQWFIHEGNKLLGQAEIISM